MLQKQPIAINFIRGLDTKSDPFQLPVGSFLNLNNSVFTTAGRLTKRPGYQTLTQLPSSARATTLSTLNGNLIATGPNLLSLSEDTNQWINKGTVQPVHLSVQSIVRNNGSQSGADSALSSNGTLCTVYVDGSHGYYQVSDSVTGEQIVSRKALPGTNSTNPRVFILGSFFVVLFIGDVGGTPTLQYLYIPINNPAAPSGAVSVTTDAGMLSFSGGFDGFVTNGSLYMAWEGANGAVNIAILSNGFVLSSTVQIPLSSASLVSVTANSVNTLFVSFWASNNGYVASFDFALNPVMTKTQFLSGVNIAELTSDVTGPTSTSVTIYYQVVHNYSYTGAVSGDNIRSDYVASKAVNPPASPPGTGIPSGEFVVLRSVGLASKPFKQVTYYLNSNPRNIITSNQLPLDPSTYTALNTTRYLIVAYGDTNQVSPLDNSNQPTYFLIDFVGNIYMKLAYSNGGGYQSSQVLPTVSYSAQNSSYYVPYLKNDFLATTNKGTNLPNGTPTNAIYTQTGVNLATFSINNNGQFSSEIAGALHLTGGQLWEYDTVRPVEHGFHVWPENTSYTTTSTVGSPPYGALAAQQYFYVFTYEWTDNQGNLHRSAPSIPMGVVVAPGSISFSATFSANSTTLTVASIPAGLVVGQFLTDTSNPTYLQANTYITDISGTTITINLPTTHANSGSSDTLNTTSTGTNTLFVPTLRVTDKQPKFPPSNTGAVNPIRIIGYRWSTAQQVYYQFTSLTSPTLNSISTDSVTITDTLPDSAILGNTVLYTTGGVVENIGAPPSIHSALFKSRLFLIDAEDTNLLWYSKEVIENTPVEMSDLFTIFVAPTSGTQGSTGPLIALSAMDDKLIMFKKDAIYYLTGLGPDNTGANNDFTDPIYITSSVGTTNPDSIVLMPQGLMFQSDKGIWLLGRDLSTTYVGAPVEAYNNLEVMSAQVIPGTTYILFVLENNITLMYDYFYQQWGTHNNVDAIFGTLYQGFHTYLNSSGLIYQMAPGTFVDGFEPVLMSLTTSWINMAGLQGYERFYFGFLLGTYHSPFKLDVSLAYNYNPSPSQSILVTPDNATPNYGELSVWGAGAAWGASSDPDSMSTANIFSARVFPELQKCQSFQVNIQEVYDPSLGVSAGEGLSLSGLLLTVGMKKGYRTQSAKRSFG